MSPTWCEAMVATVIRSTGELPTRRSQAATLIAASIGFGVIQLDVTVVNVAVKQIGAAFGGGVSELQWVISAYTLMFAARILLSGRLSARRGPACTVRAGLIAMLAGCAGLLWAGRSTPYAAMLGQQLLLGAGLGLLVPPMTGVLLASVERSRSGVASGTFTTMRQTGSMLGVALFGSLVAAHGRFFSGFTPRSSWRWWRSWRASCSHPCGRHVDPLRPRRLRLALGPRGGRRAGRQLLTCPLEAPHGPIRRRHRTLLSAVRKR
jgi:MFS family permease